MLSGFESSDPACWVPGRVDRAQQLEPSTVQAHMLDSRQTRMEVGCHALELLAGRNHDGLKDRTQSLLVKDDGSPH